MQHFNYQGAKKQTEQLHRTNSGLHLRKAQMKRGLGSREKSTGFIGVEYPNLKFDVDPTSMRFSRNAQGNSLRRTTKSQRSFSSINAHLYPRSVERNTSFTAQVDACCGQQKGLRHPLEN